MKKGLAILAVFAVAALVGAPRAHAARRIETVRQSNVTQSQTWTVAPALSVAHAATVKNVSVTSSTYTGSNVVSSTGDQVDTTITTADANSATMTDDLANTTDTVVYVESESTANDHVVDIRRNSTANLLNTDTIAGSQAVSQTVDNGNASAATSNTGSNSVSSGAKLTRLNITTAPGNSAATATTGFSGHTLTISRIIK